MDDLVNTWSLIFAFVWFVGSCITLYFWLPQKIIFNYKLNLYVLFGGIIIISLTVYLLSLIKDPNFIIIFGSLLIGPWSGFFWAALKQYLNKKKEGKNNESDKNFGHKKRL